MKFKKIFVKLAILLAVCGVLVGSPQVYAADDTPTSTAKAELAGSNEENNGNSSNDIGKQKEKKSNPDNSNIDVDQGQTNALEKIQSELSNKADGDTLYIAIVGAGAGVLALLLAGFVMCKADDLSRKHRNLGAKFQTTSNDVYHQLGSLSGKLQECESEIQRLQERIAGDRRRSIHDELMNNPPPILEPNARNMSRAVNNFSNVNNMRNTTVKAIEPIDIINKKHNEVLKEYTALISLYRNASPAFRNKRSEFMSRFEVVELACINTKERIYTHEAPIYAPKANGDFWAIPVGLQDLYIVYPRATLDYEVNVHTTGGMSEVFNSNFRKEIKYNGFDVSAPAWFVSKSPSWECKKEGQLELR